MGEDKKERKRADKGRHKDKEKTPPIGPSEDTGKWDDSKISLASPASRLGELDDHFDVVGFPLQRAHELGGRLASGQ
jgi:hypothetical protein